MHSSPALKVFLFNTINVFVFNLESGLQTPPEENSPLRMELNEERRQGGDERTQQGFRTSAVHFRRNQVVFLRSFISALFMSYFQPHP